MTRPSYRFVLVAGICLTAGKAFAAAPVPIELQAEPGRWNVRTELLYDGNSKSLVRREVRLWDMHPSAQLAFAWAPDATNPFDGGVAAGPGRLTWRPARAPAYDTSAVVIDYQGALVDGRPDGFGTERHADGLVFDGQWKNGRPNGVGHLRTSTGADYRGPFRDGKAVGLGTFTDIDGETYLGAFSGGLREGLATTTLPNEVTYRSTWHAGVEVAASRRLRLAQLGKSGAAPQQDIRIGIVVLDRPRDEDVLGYKGLSEGRLLKIVPDKIGLMEHWKGSGGQAPDLFENKYLMTGLFNFSAESLIPVRLTLNVQNQGMEAVQIVGASVKVDSSALDNEPALQIEPAGDTNCTLDDAYAPFFELRNFGLGSVRNPVMRFAFTGQASKISSANDRPKPLGTFAYTERVAFDRELAEAGAEIDKLKRRSKMKEPLDCHAKGAAACLAELRKGGLFGHLASDIFLANESYVTIGVQGTLDYDWKDEAGVAQYRRAPFRTSVVLGQIPAAAECGEGGEPVPVAEHPVELKLAGKNYRLPIRFSDTVQPGRTARYNFSLHAAKSSDHALSIAVQLADGREITSRPIDLTYFVPNRASDK